MKVSKSQFIWPSIWVCSLCSLFYLFSRIWMQLCESQFIWLTICVCSLCSPCSLVHKDLNEAFWISIHLAKYSSLFTLFTLFTWWFEWSFLNLNSFDQVFEPVHFVHLVHLFTRISMMLSESQLIWQSIWVCPLCSTCSLVHKDFNEAFWISIYLAKYLSLFTLFTLFTCSKGFQWSFLNLNSFD